MDMAMPESTGSSPGPATAAEKLRVRRKTIEAVLLQCQRALETLRDAGIDVDVEDVEMDPDRGERETERTEVKEVVTEEESGGSLTPQPSDVDYESDELYDLIKSKVESPVFLEKLDNIQKSIYQNNHGNTEEGSTWDVVCASDLWDHKHTDEDDSSEDGYVLVNQEDIVDGIATFMAAYLLSLKQTKELSPDQLQKVLGKTFSLKKDKSKLKKAWDGTKVIYNLASWSATAIGIYQNPALLKAATAAFWTSCRVISKLL